MKKGFFGRLLGAIGTSMLLVATLSTSVFAASSIRSSSSSSTNICRTTTIVVTSSHNSQTCDSTLIVNRHGLQPNPEESQQPVQNPPFYCLGGSSCNGVPSGNTGQPLPPNNDEAIGNCLLGVSLTIATTLGGVTPIYVAYKVVDTTVAEGKILIRLAKTSNTPGPASIDLAVTVWEKILPAGSCLEVLFPNLRHNLQDTLTRWFQDHPSTRH